MEEDRDLRHDSSFQERNSTNLPAVVRLPQLLEYVNDCLLFAFQHDELHDVAAIVGLPVDKDEVHFLHDIFGNDLGFQVDKKNNAYSTFNRGSGLVGGIEHKAFLFFWNCWLFVCTSSIVVVGEFVLYVLAILIWSYLNIGALFLSLLYNGLFATVSWLKNGELIKSVFWPFWFLQLWI